MKAFWNAGSTRLKQLSMDWPIDPKAANETREKRSDIFTFFFVKNSKNRLFLKISLCAAYGSYIEYVGLIGTANIKGF